MPGHASLDCDSTFQSDYIYHIYLFTPFPVSVCVCVWDSAFMDNLISPLELMLEEWKKVASQLDKDHAKG